MVAMWKSNEIRRRPVPLKRALYTEHCRDEDGNRYTVIV